MLRLQLLIELVQDIDCIQLALNLLHLKLFLQELLLQVALSDVLLFVGFFVGIWCLCKTCIHQYRISLLWLFCDRKTLSVQFFHDINWTNHAISQVLQEIGIDLYRVEELKLALRARDCLNWSSTLKGQVSLCWVQVALRGIILVTEAWFAVELTLCSLNRLQRVSIHAHSELSLYRFLEGFTLAHHWLVSQNVKKTG